MAALCDICHVRPATVRASVIRDGQPETLNLCEVDHRRLARQQQDAPRAVGRAQAHAAGETDQAKRSADSTKTQTEQRRKPSGDAAVQPDVVEEAGIESFPASDPPAWAGGMVG